jgi:hypothetical protein
VEMEMNNLLLSLRPIRQVHCCRWKCFLSSFLCTFYTCLEFPGFCEQAKQQTIGCNKIDACWMGACVVNQEQLISPNHKMVLLAALSDSLDYMSESVQQYVPEPKISCWKNACHV